MFQKIRQSSTYLDTPARGWVGCEYIRHATRRIVTDPRVVPVLVLYANTREAALNEKLLQRVSKKIMGLLFDPIARLAVCLVMVAVVAAEEVLLAMSVDKRYPARQKNTILTE